MPLAAGTMLGPYEILAPLGAGGMGEVYRARDTRLGREVALKVSAERFSERFEREARAVAALNHPNICTLYDVGPNYLVMELVEGPTLADRLQFGAIGLEETLGLARQIALALDAAHEKGIVHRDLKPGNIKIKPDGVVKVLDFGLAKMGATPSSGSGDVAESPTLSMAATQVGMILGTAAYMAPEQARGKPVDKRADIWAFGVVLYEMLVGKRLFDGEDVTETLASVVKEKPDLSLVPAQVRRLIGKCLEKDPNKRLRDIADAWALLDEERVAPAVPVAPAPRERSWLSWSLAGVFFVIAAVVSGVHFLRKPAAPEILRFQVLPPEKTNFGLYLAISPDGRKLAFSAPAPDGRPALWIRSLDAIEARLLAGTEGYDNGLPFWSPDSRYLAFGADRKLEKIDVNGGPPQALCDVGFTITGGGWSPEGTLIFGGLVTGGGLWRVPAEGGTAAPLTKLNVTNEARHALPVFLPDGRHFLYTRYGLAPADSGISIGSIDARPDQQSSRRLATTRYGAQYAPRPNSSTGYLLFLRDATLMAQPFDAGRLEVTGEATPIADRVGAFLNAGQYSASNTGVLAYRMGASRGATFQLTWFDRQGKSLGAAGPAATYQMMALSPDGAQVAAMRAEGEATASDIWLIDLARNVPTRLTFGSLMIDPVWSADGRHVVFSSAGTGLTQRLASGAGKEEILLPAKEQFHPDSISADGRFLMYGVLDPKTKSDLWILPMDGDRKPMPYLKTQFDEAQGQFSPDGRWVAYRSDESGRSEIYVQPFPVTAGGGGKWLVSNGGGAQPRWRRDGKELFYVANDRTLMAVDVSTSPSFKAGVPKPLFDAPFNPGAVNVFRWDVSADGKKFLIITTGQEAAAPPITVVLNWAAGLKK